MYHGLNIDGTERNSLDGGVDNTLLPTLCLLFYFYVFPCDLIQPIQSTCQHLCERNGIMTGVCGEACRRRSVTAIRDIEGFD